MTLKANGKTPEGTSCYNCYKSLDPNVNYWSMQPMNDKEILVCDDCYENWYIK